MTGHDSRRARAGRAAPRTSKIANKVGCQLGCAALTTLAAAGCLERPVQPLEPNTTNSFANQINVSSIEAIDLLFVVDNSISMADKQALLRQAVPLMVSRLITPDCVTEAGQHQPSDGRSCASYGADYFPEFRPVNDIHLGVITSSLGGFGSTACTNLDRQPGALDKSRLIPKVRDVVPATGEAVPDPTGLGFLAWTGAASEAETQTALAALERDLSLHVAAAGEQGCGFEAPLEAWYRFLVDPEPPLDIRVEADEHGRRAVSTGVDKAILAQRDAFLRPGSLVAIVVLTDENDCSVMEGGNLYPLASSGFVLPATEERMTAASAACAENPNDPCCHSCLLAPPEGCEDTCERPGPELSLSEDSPYVRCFDGKRRFGVDLLYPIERYVAGLKQPVITNSRTGEPAQNPLLEGRSPDLIFFAGIVGVPWQDVATDASLSDPDSLAYRTAQELAVFDGAIGGTRWDLLLGRPGLPASSPQCRPGNGTTPSEECGQTPVPPLDPFMIESIHPRSGTHPLTGESIVPSGTDGWSPINGHEYDNSIELAKNGPANDDLQYSCIFPLSDDAVKVDCAADESCDCSDEPARGRPLCKPSPNASVTADRTQRYGKAYPPGRILQVLRGFGENSIVASICPKIVDPTSPSFGYNPAVNAIVDRLAQKLAGQCLPRSLTVDTDGNVPCQLLEATQDDHACLLEDRRRDLSVEARAAVNQRMAKVDMCKLDASDGRPLPLCTEFTVCELLEADEDAKDECFGNTPPDQQAPGYCYIDPVKGPHAGGMPTGPGTCLADDEKTWGGCTNPHIASCDPTERRLLRFVGPRTPLPNSSMFVACAGDAADEEQPLPPLPPSQP